jgi:hypothetical protein
MSIFKRDKKLEREHEEELRLLREATDEVKKAAAELAMTNEALRLRLERLEDPAVV